MDRIITYNLNDNFIEKLADFLQDNYLKSGKDISQLALVFGGKRPALFLKKALAKRIKNGFLAPAFFTIDEFVDYVVAKKSAVRKISDLDACYIIYNAAKNTAPQILKGRENFSQFLPWAREVLGFIEQVDLEDIAPEQLKNVQSLANIGFDVPKNINDLLKSIIAIRDEYHNILKNKCAYSRGLKYLSAAKIIPEVDLSEFENIFFCGFFYLHKTELALVKSLYDRGKSTLFFQGSAKDWSVLEKISRHLGVPIQAEEDNQQCSLEVWKGFDVHSEACLAREALKNIKQFEKTVIVLPEPENLIPLVSEISSCCQDFNISMGYPLKRSALYSLFENIFKAQENLKGGRYYSKDYLAVLAHPLAKNLAVLPQPSITRVLVHKIEEALLGIDKTELAGSLFVGLKDLEHCRELFDIALSTMKTMGITVSRDELKEAVVQLHKLLFKSWEDISNFSDFASCLGALIDCLVKKSYLGKYPLNLKMAEKLLEIQTELAAAGFSRETFPKEEIFKIFADKILNEQISFSGSPLKGLQVLGFLETRSLNFENVIIMDVNEAALPYLKIYEPLIPREVMIGLGLNRLEKEEEIQRYQFKRLLGGAKRGVLIYQEGKEKEKSRFIEELAWEKQKKIQELEVFTIPEASFRVDILPKAVEIKKDELIIKFLKAKTYSASSINTYLSCPLKFYYQYVLALSEKEELLDEPEAKDLGTFVHQLLEERFQPFIGRTPRIDKKFKVDFQAALDEKFETGFAKNMRSDAFLVKAMLDYGLGRFLENESGRKVKKILSLEKEYSGKIGHFKFRAFVDRVDELADGSTLVIDYKTGSVSNLLPLEANIIEAKGFSRQALKQTLKSFQLPLYLYFTQASNACLYSLKDLKMAELFRKKEHFERKEEIMRTYLEALNAILNDITSPDIPFKADEEDQRLCQNCPYFYLCR